MLRPEQSHTKGGNTMPERRLVHTKNLDRYGGDALPWSRARDQLASIVPDAQSIYYLNTTRPDGRPHSVGIGAVWHDGDMYFTSNLETRKSRNLAETPYASISTRLKDLDLILEGKATIVTDPETLEALAAVYREGGWPAEAEDGALTAPFSAPSAGPPPWHLYRLVIDTAFGVATAEPYGATRWDFVVD
jgi:nitroimidazol reductase NimA-like FMN-containing flavoprotein (pyridoxamine 5'-phosphate oxidase superfamily)